MRVVLSIAISFMLAAACSLAQQSLDTKSEVQGLWNEDVYQVYTVVLANEVKAVWGYAHHDPNDKFYGANNAAEIITHFKKQSESRRKLGIFARSNSYLVPATPQEIQWMTEHMWKLYNDPVWRESEAALINELRTACQKEKITLYVNMSRNLQGRWKVLNRPADTATKQINRNTKKTL